MSASDPAQPVQQASPRRAGLRYRLYRVLEPADGGSWTSRIFDVMLVVLIVANVTAIILESFDQLFAAYAPFFHWFEFVSVLLFTVEYLLRLATADFLYPDSGPIRSRLRWMFSSAGLIDLIAILPFYVPLLIAFDLRFLRMVRILRLLRILKLKRYSRSLQLIGEIVNDRKEELLVTVFLNAILMVIASTFMYYLENEAQPEHFPNVMATMWWAVSTLTTVGYGDVYPITGMGKIFAAIIAVIGIGFVALPTGILSAAFIERIHRGPLDQADDGDAAAPPLTHCPHCGGSLREPHTHSRVD